ncbi:MAG: hypothetical protein ACK2VA_00985 [Anaerolineae bacterium]
MSQDGDEQNMGLASENAGETPEEVGTASLARSVASRLSWTQRAVSPWVRRTLAASQRDAAGRRASTALSYGATSRFLRRAQRMVEGGRSWTPELGTLDPRNVARFTEEVTARFPGTGKHTVTRLPEEETDHANEFPLPGEAQAQAARPAREGRSPAMGASVAMSAPPAPAIGTGRAGSYDGSATARSASPPRGRPATAQRSPLRRAPPPRPTREPTGRLFSRVEELPVRGAGASEPSLSPETRIAEEGLDQGVTAAQPDDEDAFGVEAGPQAGIQRRAYSAPPAQSEGAQEDARTQVGAHALGERAPESRALSQAAGQGSRPPDRATSPALQRAAEAPGEAREADTEHRKDAPVRLPTQLDDGLRADRAQPSEAEEQARPSGPAMEPLQRQPFQQESQVPSVREESARQGGSVLPDRSRATQQAESSAAAQSSTAQEDAAILPGDEGVVPHPGESEERAEAVDASPAPGEPGRAQRAAEMTTPDAAQDQPERIQAQVEGVQQQGTADRSSVSPGDQLSSVQREPLRPARAPSRAGDRASPTDAARQEQGGSQAEGAPQQEAVQRSADYVAEAAPAAGDQDVSGPPEQQGREGVARPLPGVPAEGKVPPAPGSMAREPSAGKEPADRMSAVPGTDGTATVQRQEGPAVSGGAGELGLGAGNEGEVTATGRASGTRPEAGSPERFESMPTRAGAESAARHSGEPSDPGAVQRSSVPEEARPGTAAAPDAVGTEEVESYLGDETGPASVDERPDGSPARERATPGTVRQSRTIDVPPGAAAAPDMPGRNEGDDLPGGGAWQADAGARSDALPTGEPAAPGTVRRPRTRGDADAGIGAAPGAEGMHVAGGLPGDESGPASADSGTDVRPAGEPAAQRVQRSRMMGKASSGTVSALEAMGTERVEGGSGGDAKPGASSLQRRAIGRGRPAVDAKDSTTPDTADATAVPPRGTQPGEGPYAGASTGGKGGEGPVTAHLGLARPVLQTRSVEQTAILPQLRRPPVQRTPIQRTQQWAREALPPLAGQGAALPARSGAIAGAESAVAPAATVPAVTVQPAIRPSGLAMIQRQPSIAGAEVAIARVEGGEMPDVQRAEEEEVAPSKEARNEEQDLDRLARQVYPLVKRLLAIERERRAGRWR